MSHFGAHFYLRYIAIFLSIVIFGWSLSSKYIKIKRNRDAGTHQLLPQLLNLMMFLMGILYALPMFSYASLMMLGINTIQAALLMNFIKKLIEVSGTAQRRRRQIYFCFFLIAIAFIVTMGYLLMRIENYTKRHFLCGLLYMALTMAASVSCYFDMKLAWTRETAEHLSVFWIFAALLNAGFWFAYGLIPFDKFVFLPNLFGLIFAVIQLMTCARFGNSDMVVVVIIIIIIIIHVCICDCKVVIWLCFREAKQGILCRLERGRGRS